ncbi:MAG: MGMT family protein [Actinomycetota bacterium]|nr:MGMT family protein [Actinomycetota bacterium]
MSPFATAVLGEVAAIRRGQVRSYGAIAARVGSPRAVRAVGTAVGRNPIPLLVPCHRVVRSDGRIGEFAMGVDAKRKLLASEGLGDLRGPGIGRRGL